MNALKVYEINELEENELLNKAVSYDEKGNQVSLLKDSVWDFTKSDFCRSYQQSQYKLRFDYTLENGSNINQYDSLMNTVKCFTYILLKEKSFTTAKKGYYLTKNLLNYLIDNNILNFEEIDSNTVLGYRQFVFEKYKGNNNLIYRNLRLIKELNDQRRFLPNCFKENIMKNIDYDFNVKTKDIKKEWKQTKVIDDKTLKGIIEDANKVLESSEQLINSRNDWNKLRVKYGYYENRDEKTKLEKNNITKIVNRKFLKYNDEYNNINDFKDHQRDVVFSSMTLILAYTGMRMSEILSIPVECLKYKETYSGEHKYDICYIKSTTFKYETDVMGTKNTNDMRSEWLANGEVAKAVSVLQRLYEFDRKLFNCDVLFCSSVGSVVKQLSYSYVDSELKKLIKDDEFASHQFRRTFARLVARSAFGDVSILQEHFKHRTREVTEYYMNGDVDNEFLEMVDEEQSEIKKSILWDELLKKAKADFGDDLENKLKGDENE